MKRIISRVVLVTLLTMTLATLGVLPLSASEKYQIIDLGTLGGTSSGARAINNRGQVVGYVSYSGTSAAFLWEDGVMKDLVTLGGNFTHAQAINNRGQIVGTSLTASGESHAVLWTKGHSHWDDED